MTADAKRQASNAAVPQASKSNKVNCRERQQLCGYTFAEVLDRQQQAMHLLQMRQSVYHPMRKQAHARSMGSFEHHNALEPPAGAMHQAHIPSQ
jgi:hypothetical protein